MWDLVVRIDLLFCVKKNREYSIPCENPICESKPESGISPCCIYSALVSFVLLMPEVAKDSLQSAFSLSPNCSFRPSTFGMSGTRRTYLLVVLAATSSLLILYSLSPSS